MEWTTKFAYSKVAQRIFSLFILCALVPIVALALISFREVNRQLNEDSRQQLRDAAKAEGMAIYERLQLVDSDMIRVAANIAAQQAGTPAGSVLAPDTRDLFRGLGVLSARGLRPLLGRVELPPRLTSFQERHIASGNAILATSNCGTSVCVSMFRYLDARHPERGLLIGDVSTDTLLNRETLPSATILCVTDSAGAVIRCPAQGASVALLQAGRQHSSGDFEWGGERQAYVAGYWKLFLKPTFAAGQWTIILSKPRQEILSPTKNFGRTFAIVILLALLVVVLLTLVQIRRSMVPLQKLQGATRQIADRRFDIRVEISSGDEFQELGDSFNQMSRDLGKQFRALEMVREVDRAILSSLRSEEIVKTVLERMCTLLPYQAIGITLLGEEGGGQGLMYAATQGGYSEGCIGEAVLSEREVAELHHQTSALRFDSPAGRSYLLPLAEREMTWFLVLPIRYEDSLLGVLAFGNKDTPVESPDDRVYATQLADRLAVALSNARLVEELATLNLGTLTALARAIDAKSQWTAGHSERVTRMAVEIGRELGLPEKELTILHRGGLLHDIGKIGTPPNILDKPGKLTDEEFGVMREHVTTGARILEPIPGYKELLPIVTQHHERFDGTGYPRGLAGEEISLHGRIFAVADVYDALISDRPYRPGWQLERVLAFMREQAGKHFDPRVVEAFLTLMKRENMAAAAAGAGAPGSAQNSPGSHSGGQRRRTQWVG